MEEEKYTNKIIEAFNTGTIDLPESASGITLRAYLAEKLGCDPMRITKKYTGTSCLGKRVYHCDVSKASPEAINKIKLELNDLEIKFKEKLEQTTREKRESELSVAEFQNHMITTPGIEALMGNSHQNNTTWSQYNLMNMGATNPTAAAATNGNNLAFALPYMQQGVASSSVPGAAMFGGHPGMVNPTDFLNQNMHASGVNMNNGNPSFNNMFTAASSASATDPSSSAAAAAYMNTSYANALGMNMQMNMNMNAAQMQQQLQNQYLQHMQAQAQLMNAANMNVNGMSSLPKTMSMNQLMPSQVSGSNNYDAIVAAQGMMKNHSPSHLSANGTSSSNNMDHAPATLTAASDSIVTPVSVADEAGCEQRGGGRGREVSEESNSVSNGHATVEVSPRSAEAVAIETDELTAKSHTPSLEDEQRHQQRINTAIVGTNSDSTTNTVPLPSLNPTAVVSVASENTTHETETQSHGDEIKSTFGSKPLLPSVSEDNNGLIKVKSSPTVSTTVTPTAAATGPDANYFNAYAQALAAAAAKQQPAAYMHPLQAQMQAAAQAQQQAAAQAQAQSNFIYNYNQKIAAAAAAGLNPNNGANAAFNGMNGYNQMMSNYLSQAAAAAVNGTGATAGGSGVTNAGYQQLAAAAVVQAQAQAQAVQQAQAYALAQAQAQAMQQMNSYTQAVNNASAAAAAGNNPTPLSPSPSMNKIRTRESDGDLSSSKRKKTKTAVNVKLEGFSHTKVSTARSQDSDESSEEDKEAASSLLGLFQHANKSNSNPEDAATNAVSATS